MGDDPAPYELPAEGVSLFAELGSATGPISRLLAPCGVSCVTVDLNPPPGAFSPMALGGLRHVPLASERFDAVAAMNCLYFLPDPVAGVREAHRLLRPGGIFLAGAPSRFHDVELQHVLPNWGERSSFDAKDAVAMVAAGGFTDVEAEWWEAPAYHLPDRSAVVDYLVAFRVDEPERRAELVETPTQVTKSGINVWARR